MNVKSIFLFFLAGATLSACKTKDSGEVVPEDPGNFILTVAPPASQNKADYLVTSSTLESGTASIVGNGVEQDGTYRYYVTTNGKFFSMLYGQGNPGAVTTYNIVDGKLNRLSNFQTQTVQAFAPVNDDLLLLRISRNLTQPTTSWYKVNTNSLTITSEGSFNSLTMTGLGELAHFTWIKQVGTKIFAPYQTVGGPGGGFNTNHPDKGWIAVFNYADMKLEKIIEDTRTSFIGRYFTDGLSLMENGDVYAYSSSVATTNNALSSTKPSAITRIKSGTTEFDQSYYFDFEAVSGGMNITNWIYLGDNTFVVQATAKAQKGAYADGSNLGIVNVANKTFKAVTGMPAIAEITNVTDNNYTPKDGKTAYFGVNLKDGTSYVYKVDASTATATRGIKVEGGSLTAIQHLN